jgi:putative MATE family efflux protein
MSEKESATGEREESSSDEQNLHKDWTKGPILKNLLLLSWPMVVMESLYVVSQFYDMIWVGRIGASSVAGVGIASIVLIFIMSIDYGLIIGVRAMIARHVGSHDMAGAGYVAGQAFLLAAIWGAVMTVIGYFVSGPIMGLFGAHPDVVREGTKYLWLMFAGWVPLEILVMGLYVIQATGDTMRPMIIEFLIRVFHVIVCPLLVMGYWGFPRMGVEGAALANVLSQVLGAAMGLWLLLAGRTRLHLKPGDFSMSPQTMVRILKIGVPAVAMQFQRSFGTIALAWLIVPFGTLAVAAHSLVAKIDMCLFMPSVGLGSGAAVLVGQNLGAHQPRRAERGAWLAVGFVELFLLVSSLAIFLWPAQIMEIFTPDEDLIGVGVVFLKIAAISYILLAPAAVLQSCIAGAGDTLPNMIISIGVIWAVQIPLAYFLPKVGDLGVLGVRWAIVASALAGAAGYLFYFSLGRWKRKRI